MLKDGYGYVYLLKEDGDNVMYKIGVTKSPKIEDRIKKLQTGNGNRIILEVTTNKLKKITNNEILTEITLY